MIPTEQSECALAGAVLIYGLTPELLDLISKVSDDWFTNHNCKEIFKAAKRLENQKSPIDMFSVPEEIERFSVNGSWQAECNVIANLASSKANIKNYCFTFEQRVRVNKALTAMDEAKQAAIETRDAKKAAEILDNALANIKFEQPKRAKHISVAHEAYINDVSERDGKADRVIKSGIDSLDDLIGGFYPGQFNVIAGRPGSGKSEFAMTIAARMAVKAPVLFISLEMDEIEISERVIAEGAGMSVNFMAKSSADDFEDHHWAKMSSAIKDSSGGFLHYDDDSILTPNGLRAKLLDFKREHPAATACFVDYIGLLELPNDDNRALAISRLTRAMQQLSKELKMVLFGLAQLNRAGASRGNKRPMLSDLRESGSIEQDASVVIFTHREDDLDPDCDQSLKGMAEIIVGKSRKGGKGTVFNKFINGHFIDMDQHDAPSIDSKAIMETNGWSNKPYKAQA